MGEEKYPLDTINTVHDSTDWTVTTHVLVWDMDVCCRT